MMQATQSRSRSSAKAVVQVMWCCCHWGLRPDQLLSKLPDEPQLAGQLALFDCRELTAAAWTCGVLHGTQQQHLLAAIAEQAAAQLPITGARSSRLGPDYVWSCMRSATMPFEVNSN